MSLKSETKDAHPQKRRSRLFGKHKISGKQKFDVKQVEDEHFMFNVKQLKINKFIKYIWQLIISSSNATLEITSLRPFMPKCDFNKVAKHRCFPVTFARFLRTPFFKEHL